MEPSHERGRTDRGRRRTARIKVARSPIVRLEASIALGLLSTAVVWSWVRDLELASYLRADATGLLAGAALTTALCATLPFFTSTWASRVLLLRDMKGVWDEILSPLGRSLSFPEIAALAALSGISEEILFRGILQQEFGILAASILFGLLHPIHLTYVLWAASVGIGLGLLVETTGSLLPAILCHGGYNFAALLYLRYWYDQEPKNDLLLAR